jgi:nicotinamide-nucleotide amidase
MKAELIAVGSEMLRFGRRDTNGEWLVEQLHRVGVDVAARSTVDDDTRQIASSVSCAVERSDLVILVGGLGPSEDDRTREGLAQGLGLPLERDAARVRRLQQLFAARRRKFRAVQERQADRPRGAVWIENPLGTAPGLSVDSHNKKIFALPGVPAEMKEMFARAVLPELARQVHRSVARRTLKIAGRVEASVEEQLGDLYDSPGLTVTILAGREGIELKLVCEGRNAHEAATRLQSVEQAMSDRLGRDLYALDDRSLAEVDGELLVRLGATVATAESCTAGLVAATLTAVPGSSSWYRGGLVVYSDDLKRKLAGVSDASLEQHGAVSEEVARELARGARERCAADYGIGITGIAGPGGGSEEKPVGLVHSALADENGTRHWRILHFGDRELVRQRSVTAALDRLRRRLLEELERRDSR